MLSFFKVAAKTTLLDAARGTAATVILCTGYNLYENAAKAQSGFFPSPPVEESKDATAEINPPIIEV